MFSKSNWKLWAIFITLTAIIGALIIMIFDLRRVQQYTFEQYFTNLYKNI